jgi:molybdate-binding protein
MIQEYGEEKFWEIEKQQYKMIVLSQKVQKDLVEKVKKENPKMSEQEIYFQAQKEYEELLVSQVNSLEIEIL